MKIVKWIYNFIVFFAKLYINLYHIFRFRLEIYRPSKKLITSTLKQILSVNASNIIVTNLNGPQIYNFNLAYQMMEFHSLFLIDYAEIIMLSDQ